MFMRAARAAASPALLGAAQARHSQPARTFAADGVVFDCLKTTLLAVAAGGARLG
jgi:hypothetical protein